MNSAMQFVSQLNFWRLIVAAALGAVAYLALHGSGRDSAREPGGSPVAASSSRIAAPSGAVQSTHNATVLGPANIPLPQGEWEATGRVVWVQQGTITNQPVGAMLKRSWDFHRVCHSTCKIAFFRWTLYGPSATWLVRHGRFFTARFPPVKVPCSYPRGSSYTRHLSGQSHDYYRLWLSSDGSRIQAIEHRTQIGCYRTPDRPDITRWQATRSPRRAPATETPS